MNRKEEKTLLKNLHPEDWRECLACHDEIDHLTVERIVQELTLRYFKLVDEYNKLSDDDDVSTILKDIQAYKLAIILFNSSGMVEQKVSANDVLNQLQETIDTLDVLVLPDTYKDRDKTMNYTAERMTIDINNLHQDMRCALTELSALLHNITPGN